MTCLEGVFESPFGVLRDGAHVGVRYKCLLRVSCATLQDVQHTHLDECRKLQFH